MHFSNPSSGFDRLVANGQVQKIPNTPFWYPVFRTYSEAFTFGMRSAELFRRPSPRLRTHVDVHHIPTGFAATCEVAIAHYGVESGLIICHGGNNWGFGGNLAGIYLRERAHFPIVCRPSYVVTTESGSKYLVFGGGIAFGRSPLDGPMPVATEIRFAYDEQQAADAQLLGGQVISNSMPEEGLFPLYCYQRSRFMSKFCRYHSAGTYRMATRITRVQWVS